MLIQSVVIARNYPWQRFYLFSVGLAAMNILSVTLTFRPAKEEFLQDRDLAQQLELGVPMVRRGEGAPVVVDETTVEAASSKSAAPVSSTRNLGSIESNTRVEEQASRHNLPRNSLSISIYSGESRNWMISTVFMTAIKTPAVWVFGFFVSMYTGRQVMFVLIRVMYWRTYSEGVTSGYVSRPSHSRIDIKLTTFVRRLSHIFSKQEWVNSGELHPSIPLMPL
jgi:hypothetical protein